MATPLPLAQLQETSYVMTSVLITRANCGRQLLFCIRIARLDRQTYVFEAKKLPNLLAGRGIKSAPPASRQLGGTVYYDGGDAHQCDSVYWAIPT